MDSPELNEIIERHGKNLKQEIGLALSEQEAKDIIKSAVSEVFSLHVVGSSLLKVCKGCGSLSTKVIDKKYLACCPDNNYIPMEEYCKKAIYPDKQF